jgi:hypothetical protein
MPSARTSVGNKEYEYKSKKECAANLQQAGNRRETIVFGDAAVAVALRHVVDRKAGRTELSTVFFVTKLPDMPDAVWTASRPSIFTRWDSVGFSWLYARERCRARSRIAARVQSRASSKTSRPWRRLTESLRTALSTFCSSGLSTS